MILDCFRDGLLLFCDLLQSIHLLNKYNQAQLSFTGTMESSAENLNVSKSMIDAFKTLSAKTFQLLEKCMSDKETPDFVFQFVGDRPNPSVDQLKRWMEQAVAYAEMSRNQCVIFEVGATLPKKCKWMHARPLTRRESLQTKLILDGNNMPHNIFFISWMGENGPMVNQRMAFAAPPWLSK